MYLIIFAILLQGEWRVFADLPDDQGFPIYLNPTVSGGYVVGYTGPIQNSCFRSEVEVFQDGSLSEPVSVSPASASIGSMCHLIRSDHNSLEDSLSAVMISPSGDTLWTTFLMEFRGEEENIAIVTPSSTGGCFVVFKADNGSRNWDLFKLDPTGGIVFQSSFTMTGGPVLSMNEMVETLDGGIVMTGVTDDFGMNLYMFLVGFDGEGNNRLFEMDPLLFHASGELLQTDASGDLIVCGYTGNKRDDDYFLPPANTDVFLECIDPLGNMLWQSVFPLPQQNSPRVMLQNPGEGCIALIVSSFPEDLSEDPTYSLVVFRPE